MESYDEYAKRARLMADVHGRSSSVTKLEDDPLSVSSPPKAKSDERAVLQSASDNSHRANQVAPSADNTAMKPAAKKLNKKKSLKRL